MREQIIHLHPAAPSKPNEGEPCNGCGICCALETCPAARIRFLQIKGPCPALEWSASQARYYCGLLIHPKQYFKWIPAAAETISTHLLSRWIAAGKGCDCNASPQD